MRASKASCILFGTFSSGTSTFNSPSVPLRIQKDRIDQTTRPSSISTDARVFLLVRLRLRASAWKIRIDVHFSWTPKRVLHQQCFDQDRGVSSRSVSGWNATIRTNERDRRFESPAQRPSFLTNAFQFDAKKRDRTSSHRTCRASKKKESFSSKPRESASLLCRFLPSDGIRSDTNGFESCFDANVDVSTKTILRRIGFLSNSYRRKIIFDISTRKIQDRLSSIERNVWYNGSSTCGSS